MNIIYNALSAKNVKIHGMSTARWTTKDKITQYKGLVNLYTRDRKINEADSAFQTKARRKTIQTLRKTIDADRVKLDNANKGDRQKLHNILSEHRDLQLAHRNSDPLIVTENVHQWNFIKRKILDKLQYQLKLKSDELIALKLEKSILEDRLRYPDLGKIKEEKVAQIISGKVQDAFLKKEAALAIQQTYHQIVNVMKRDTYYFDGILSCIQRDYEYQCRCIINAIVQGQLATEYKSDREEEFKMLEKAVIVNIKAQREDLHVIREQTENLQSNLKLILRKDSDLTTCVVKVKESHDFKVLREDMEKIKATLHTLAESSLVTSFDQIFPSIQEQRRQKKRLSRLATKCEQNRDIMLNKLNHAELMTHVLENTMVETTGEYSMRKKELLSQLEEQKEKKKTYEHSKDINHNLIAHIRIALRQIQQLCRSVHAGKKVEQLLARDVMEPPVEEETDGIKMIADLTPKLQALVSSVTEQLAGEKLDTAYKLYEQLMRERTGQKDDDIKSETNLIEDDESSDLGHVLTRQDIKLQSDEIVAAHQQNDDLVPMFVMKKKRKFK